MKTLLSLSLIVALTASCQNNNKSDLSMTKEDASGQTTPQEEWLTLFDGTNFDQWRGYLSEGMPEAWSIQDSAMVFTPGGQGGQNIITKDVFYNFELSLEWNIAPGGNSGIFWGVIEDPAYPEAYQSGPEIQVLDNERHPDAKANPKYHQAGALYDLVQPSKDVCKPAGEWNHILLTIDHNKNEGSVELNGTKIVEFPLKGEAWDTMVTNSKFKDRCAFRNFGKYETGKIGLQDHGDLVSFRNIKILKL